MIEERIGLLGGTFNPVHFGHLQLACAAMNECNLSRVIFVPSAQPPHKDENSIASYADRVAMLQIACGVDKRFAYSTIESNLPTPSYTIDTLRAIDASFTGDIIFFFIIGEDAFLDLLSWKSYEEILQKVTLIVAHRQGYRTEQLAAFMTQLQYSASGNVWSGRTGCRDIIVLKTIPEEFSATNIREKLAQSIFPEKTLPSGVLEYIQNNNLYQSKNAKLQRSA